jgi:DNA-binding transcriptional ArsR family regulator
MSAILSLLNPPAIKPSGGRIIRRIGLSGDAPYKPSKSAAFEYFDPRTQVLDALRGSVVGLKRREIERMTGMKRSRVSAALKSLLDDGIVEKIHSGQCDWIWSVA